MYFGNLNELHNKSLLRSGIHKVPGRGRLGPVLTLASRARVLKGQSAAAALSR